MQNQIQCLEAGLEFLAFSPKEEALVASPRVHVINSNVSLLSQNIDDDCINRESCSGCRNNSYNPSNTSCANHAGENQLQEPEKRIMIRKKQQKEKKEFPPPISLLGRTQSYLKRYYTVNGRLILMGEVKHHKYFRAHRSNGRLTLQLLPLDDDVLGCFPEGFDDQNDVADEFAMRSYSYSDEKCEGSKYVVRVQ